MSKITYEYLFGSEPLFPTYMQLQMAAQSIGFPDGIAKDVMVKIQDHYAPADFMVLDIGEEDDETPIILGRPFLNTTNAIIYVGSGQVPFQFPREKYAIIPIVIPLMNSQKRVALGGDNDHPDVKGTNTDGMNGEMKSL
jgi:hypothetical protein